MVQPVTGREKIDKDKAVSWLNKHWQGNKLCPICSHNEWTVSDELAEIRPFKGGALTVGGSLYPLLVVTCATCGHTLLFNAVLSGLAQGPG